MRHAPLIEAALANGSLMCATSMISMRKDTANPHWESHWKTFMFFTMQTATMTPMPARATIICVPTMDMRLLPVSRASSEEDEKTESMDIIASRMTTIQITLSPGRSSKNLAIPFFFSSAITVPSQLL